MCKPSTILDNINRKQIRGCRIDNEGGVCALGAIALVEFDDPHSNQVYSLFKDQLLPSQIIIWNDTDELSFHEIAEKLRERGY